jgi:hypothetical protein
MQSTFVHQLVTDYLNFLGIDSSAIVARVIEECSVEAEIQETMSRVMTRISSLERERARVMTRISSLEREREDAISSTRDAEMMENHRRRRDAYVAICNDYCEYAYVRIWRFGNEGPSLPVWLSNVFETEDWSIDEVISRTTENRVLTSLQQLSRDYLHGLNIQVLARLYVHAYENGMLVGFC